MMASGKFILFATAAVLPWECAPPGCRNAAFA